MDSPLSSALSDVAGKYSVRTRLPGASVKAEGSQNFTLAKKVITITFLFELRRPSISLKPQHYKDCLQTYITASATASNF